MIPLYNPEQVRSADTYAINKMRIPGTILMENAAISIVESILYKYPYVDNSFKFGIICGKGNNGGDGFAVARQLLIKGFSVHVVSLATEKELKGDALINFKILSNLIEDYPDSSFNYFKSTRDLQKVLACEFIVDAILGTGSSGNLKDPIDKIIPRLNEAQAIKIAIDSPTGLNLNNASGEIIFNANLTVTLAALKTGLFYERGSEFSGKVLSGSIGIGRKFFESKTTNEYLVEPEDVLTSLPTKQSTLNKYSAGKSLVIAGSSNMPGAAIFAINAAMMSGSGAGFLAIPNSVKELSQTQMNCAIVYDYSDEGTGYLGLDNVKYLEEKISWADAIAIGPGLGREVVTQKSIIQLLNNHPNKKFVIDADAIYALENKVYKRINLSGCVFTPHHKEFADLLGLELDELKLDLINIGRQFTKQTNTFLVLKGAPTIIFTPDSEAFINTSGNVGLAKFGSGDVLTGIITSFLAQNPDVEKSIISAVYIHSLSADIIKKKESEFGITPQKIIDQIPRTIKFLRKSVV